MLAKTRIKKPAERAPAFTPEILNKLADDLQSRRIPLPKITMTDDMQPGLQAIIRATGLISFHALYVVREDRQHFKIGDFPEMSVQKARGIVKTIRGLADKDIDVQDGLLPRLIKELESKGTNWRP